MVRHGEHRRMIPDGTCGGGCRRAEPKAVHERESAGGSRGRNGRSGIVWQAENGVARGCDMSLPRGHATASGPFALNFGESSMHHVRLKALAAAIAMAAASSVCAGTTAHATSN